MWDTKKKNTKGQKGYQVTPKKYPQLLFQKISCYTTEMYVMSFVHYVTNTLCTYMTVESISMAFQNFPSDPIILHSLVSGYEMLSRAQPLTIYIIHYKSMKITFEPQALIASPKFYK